MNQKALLRHKVVVLIAAGALSQALGALQLNISERQMRRILRRYKQEGAEGLTSKRYGKASGNRMDLAKRNAIITHINAPIYQGFKPTLLCEKLAKLHNIKISIETLRKLMITEGTWQSKPDRPIIRHPLRDRRARFGELIQIDGSPHAWLEDRAPIYTLIVFIDDATSRLTHLEFTPTETSAAYMRGIKNHIAQYGAPETLYSDRHAIFRSNRKSDKTKEERETQFSRALRDLNIELICARSPQAKGRVERVNQTLQDRLTKEMRLQGINDYDTANAWLPTFIEEHNQQFAKKPESQKDAHTPYYQECSPNSNEENQEVINQINQANQEAANKLEAILSHQEDRVLSKELTISYHGRLFQITEEKSGRHMRHAKVTVHESLDGVLTIKRSGRDLVFHEVKIAKKRGVTMDTKELKQHLDCKKFVAKEKEAQENASKKSINPTAQSAKNKTARNNKASLQATG